jgi:acetylserotonin N-methyltransferase
MRVDDKYLLSRLGEEYLVKGSDYYVGPSLYGMLEARLPPRLQKGEKPRYFARTTGTLWHKLKYYFSSREMGRPERLAVQHSRNYPAAVMAVSNGIFDGIHHLLDVGGGSGAFLIPLIRSRTDVSATLMELPRALPHIQAFLASRGVLERIHLLGANMHKPPWPPVSCDGVLLANILHFCSDGENRVLLREAYRVLPAGGKLFIHEMLWNENRDGPLTTALWNFWMTSVSAGKQRTLHEIAVLLREAGFDHLAVAETWGSFSMITCTRQ